MICKNSPKLRQKTRRGSIPDLELTKNQKYGKLDEISKISQEISQKFLK